MRRIALLGLVTLALASAGCTQGDGSPFKSHQATAPYYMEYIDTVELQHQRTYTVPVREGAAALQIDVALAPKDGAPAPLSAANLVIELFDADGKLLAKRDIDARNPNATLGLTQFKTLGDYVVRVTGSGLSTLPQGTDTGLRYALSTEVVYS